MLVVYHSTMRNMVGLIPLGQVNKLFFVFMVMSIPKANIVTVHHPSSIHPATIFAVSSAHAPLVGDSLCHCHWFFAHRMYPLAYKLEEPIPIGSSTKNQPNHWIICPISR